MIDAHRHRIRFAGCSCLGLAAGVSVTLSACTSDLKGPLDKGSQSLPAPEAHPASTVALTDKGAAQGQRTRSANPFEGTRFHVDPSFSRHVGAAAALYPALASQMARVAALPTAVWIDTIAGIGRVSQTLESAAAEGATGGPPVLSVFVLYDLPNRDCSARSSAGELTLEHGGEPRYRTEFIDPIAAAMAAHSTQRVAVLLEPDSLANLATNTAIPRCAASDAAQRRSIAYAISKLDMPNVDLYLDAAHAGWLGWTPNRTKIAAIYEDVLGQAGGAAKIRGFFTNVSNYNVLEGDDGKRLEPTTPCPDELTYVAKLRETLAAAGIVGEGFVIDTGRNGRAGIRTNWGHWCNVAGAGLGERPRAAPAPGIDAYFWVKPPGDSDGSSNPTDPQFDQECGSEDAARGAPSAGQWFPAYFADLVRNAAPTL
jgi:cellulose 1,4-beta-cellobiosidase